MCYPKAVLCQWTSSKSVLILEHFHRQAHTRTFDTQKETQRLLPNHEFVSQIQGLVCMKIQKAHPTKEHSDKATSLLISS